MENDQIAQARTKADWWLGQEEKILELYNRDRPEIYVPAVGAGFVRRVEKPELEALRAESDEEFIEEVILTGWQVGFNYDVCGVSVSELEWDKLVTCEIERRSILSPEYGKRLQEVIDKVNKETQIARSKQWIEEDEAPARA